MTPAETHHDPRRNYRNNLQNTWKTSASCSNYEETKALQQAVSTIRSLQSHCPDIIFSGLYRLDVAVYGRTTADEDNIRKSINDALQGYATRNDRDSKGGSIELHDR
jgi:hypothetical protein